MVAAAIEVDIADRRNNRHATFVAVALCTPWCAEPPPFARVWQKFSVFSIFVNRQ